jgi:hypothetical protein
MRSLVLGGVVFEEEDNGLLKSQVSSHRDHIARCTNIAWRRYELLTEEDFREFPHQGFLDVRDHPEYLRLTSEERLGLLRGMIQNRPYFFDVTEFRWFECATAYQTREEVEEERHMVRNYGNGDCSSEDDICADHVLHIESEIEEELRKTRLLCDYEEYEYNLRNGVSLDWYDPDEDMWHEGF